MKCYKMIVFIKPRIKIHQNGYYCLVSCDGQMVIILAFFVGGQSSIPGWVDILGSVSVNRILTELSCKNDTSKCGEDRIMCVSLAWDVWR